MAKQLLNGQKVVVVRCEALNISGEFFRAKRTFSPLRLISNETGTSGGRYQYGNWDRVQGHGLIDGSNSEVPRLPQKDD